MSGQKMVSPNTASTESQNPIENAVGGESSSIPTAAAATAEGACRRRPKKGATLTMRVITHARIAEGCRPVRKT